MGRTSKTQKESRPSGRTSSLKSNAHESSDAVPQSAKNAEQPFARQSQESATPVIEFCPTISIGEDTDNSSDGIPFIDVTLTLPISSSGESENVRKSKDERDHTSDVGMAIQGRLRASKTRSGRTQIDLTISSRNDASDRDPPSTSSRSNKGITSKGEDVSKIKVPEEVPIIADPSNILLTHERVMEVLNSRFENARVMRDKLERMRWIRDNSIDKLEIVRATKNVFEIEKILKTVDDRREISAYEKDVGHLLSRYIALETAERSFVAIPNSGGSSADAERDKISRAYLTIAKRYVDLTFPADKRVMSCERCGGRDFDVIEESLYACKLCGGCTRFLEETHSYKDVDRINLSSRYKYTRKTHFKEAYYNRTGQNIIIDEEVYKILKEQCRKYSIPLSNVTKETVEMMLIDNGYEKLREYALIIHRTLTGKKIPDTSHLENDLFDRFDDLEEVLPAILKEYGKTNSINVDYKVLKLLQFLGVPCSRGDYDIHKEKLQEYDEIMERAFVRLGWKFPPTV